MSRVLLVQADGGSRGNPGPAGYGALVVDAATGQVLVEDAASVGVATNNVAEYSGLVAGLRAATALDPEARIDVEMDSKLVIEQMSGRWQIKHEDMRRLAAQARALVSGRQVTYRWIPRARNSHADRLANEAMDAAARGRTWTPPPGRGAPGTGTGGADGAGGTTGSDGTSGGDGTPGGTGPSSSRAPKPVDDGSPTTLVLVRHGRTVFTEQKRLSGRGGDDPELSPAGLDDAARVARRVAALGTPGTWPVDVGRPDLVVASPIRRCQQTGGAVAAACGVPLVTDEAWAEISFGEWDGLTYAQVAARYPREFVRWQGSVDHAPTGGESLVDFRARIDTALAATLEAHRGRTVVVATHTTPVRAVLARALDAGSRALWRVRIEPASVSVVRFWGGLDDLDAGTGGVEVVASNVVDHLV